MSRRATRHKGFAFGEYWLDLDRATLHSDGAEIPLRAQSFEVLRHLLEHHGRLVTRDELMQTIWGGTVVTEGSLTHCIIDIRRAIGDVNQTKIRTVRKRGYIFDEPLVPAGPTARSSLLRPWSSAQWAVVALGTALAIAAAVWWVGRAPVGNPSGHVANSIATGQPVSIAVLPFEDMSASGDQRYFADGVADEILNLLAQSPELQVVARTSSFSLKGRDDLDIPAIGQRLNAAYVLEGSVRKSGDNVRVIAQLIDAAHGMHLWSQSYDRKLGDLLVLQSDIASEVAAALEVNLRRETVSENTPSDPVAYDHYLLAQHLYGRRGPGDLASAEEHYQKAVQLDPRFARAWVGLAAVARVRSREGEIPYDAGMDRMQFAVRQALELAPNLVEAHLRAGIYYLEVGDAERAWQHWEHARELDPNDILVLSLAAGKALNEGDAIRAVQLQRRAVALDPVGYVNRGNLAEMLWIAGDFEQAAVENRYARQLNPVFAAQLDTRHAFIQIMLGNHESVLADVSAWEQSAEREQALALIHDGMGHPSEVRAAMARIAAMTDYDAAVALAELHVHFGEHDKALDQLGKAHARFREQSAPHERDRWVHRVIHSRFLQPLRQHPAARQYFELPEFLKMPANEVQVPVAQRAPALAHRAA